jgi:hypothetical protein
MTTKSIPDAGTGMLPLRQQKYGAPGEVYLCPTHTGDSCAYCGGKGFRAICDNTGCHEHGCQSGCSRSAEDFRLQQLHKVTP